MWSVLTPFLVFMLPSLMAYDLSGSTLPGGDIQDLSGKTLLQTGPGGSLLYRLDSPNAVYEDSVLLLDLKASTSFLQGYDTGYMLGDEMAENYNNLMLSLFGDEWWEPAAAALVSKFLDWQWENYLSIQLPEEYIQELKGMTAGGIAAAAEQQKGGQQRKNGLPSSIDIGKLAARGITLANLPGTLSNIKYIIADEKENPPPGELANIVSSVDRFFRQKSKDVSDLSSSTSDRLAGLLKKALSGWSGLTCSMFGTWGSRTEAGALFTGRNLDWLKDSGISKYKLVTVHRPPQGKNGEKRYAHATVGWAGIWGAITGMNSEGLTVHEANLESDDITFRGFPWILRLRHAMSLSRTLDEAMSVWNSTNNTVGFNHGFGSAADGRALVMETMGGNTAVFSDNDPREQAGLVVNGEQIGAPRTEAVYRTNHGYDEYTINHYAWNGTSSYNNSIARYMLFPEIFDSYAMNGVKISYREAINITALVADKGEEHVYDCDSPHDEASNILSVTFDPGSLVMYAAWENGHGEDSWKPAACNTYLKLDFKYIF